MMTKMIAAAAVLSLLPQIIATQSSAGFNDDVASPSYFNNTKHDGGSATPPRYSLASPLLLPDEHPLSRQQQQRRLREFVGGNNKNENDGNNGKTPTAIITKLESTLLHVGKAGGGKVVARADSLGFPFRYKKIHPFPRPVEELKQQKNERYKTLVVAIRDPIDRFASSFYWEALVACARTEGDARGTHHESECNSWTNTKHCCMDYAQREREKPFYERFARRRNERSSYERLNDPEFWAKYNKSASDFAEAFCGDDYEGQREEAVEDLKLFKHSYIGIHDWLFTHNKGWLFTHNKGDGDHEWNKNKNKKNNGGKNDDDDMEWMDGKLVAVVQEPEYDFTEQIDGAIEWVLSKTATENVTAAFRRAAAAAEDASSSGNRTDDDYRDDPRLHSSKSLEFAWVSPPEERSRMSDKGSCCLARHYYRRDYELLSNADFVRRVCKGPAEATCRRAVRSVANRGRAAALSENAGGPCGSGKNNTTTSAFTQLQLPPVASMYETQWLGLLIGAMPLLLFSRRAIGFAIKRHCVALLGFLLQNQ